MITAKLSHRGNSFLAMVSVLAYYLRTLRSIPTVVTYLKTKNL